jgi:hypothetical protein
MRYRYPGTLVEIRLERLQLDDACRGHGRAYRGSIILGCSRWVGKQLAEQSDFKKYRLEKTYK